MAEATKAAVKKVAKGVGSTSAISFLVFDEKRYAAANPDAEKAVGRGQHHSLHEHWHKVGRAEHLVGKRRAGCAAYELSFEDGAYLRAFPDIAQALGSKASQAAFGHWVRHGWLETLAGDRPDVFGIRSHGAECLLKTLPLERGHLTVFALRVGSPAAQFEVVARGADDAWLPLDKLEVKNLQSSSNGAGAPEQWVAGVFTSKVAPAQVFVACGRSQGGWSEHVMAAIPAATGESAPRPSGVMLFQALRESALFKLHLKALLECFLPNGGESISAQKVHVEVVELLSPSYLRCSGWIIDRLEPWTTIHVHLGEASVQIDPGRCLRHRRPDLQKISGITEDDVYQAGFFALEPTRHAGPAAKSAIVLAVSASQVTWQEVEVAHLEDNPGALIRACINRMPLERAGQLVPFLKAGAGKVFAELIARRAASLPNKSTEVAFGAALAAPSASIIIPLYGRIDFMKHQLAHFSQDPELGSVEIIYVLDDPKHREWTLRLAELCWALFKVPFKLVLMQANHGYGGANNAGAARANAPYLVLLNSDVMPKDRGWAKALTAPLTDPEVGIVGARLLYHDGTIQHDGMAYSRNQRQSTNGGLVECIHPGKGVVPTPLHAGQAEVAAVTGACLAMRRADFEQVGGFSNSYFVGDYEDSDLCLKIRAQKKRIVVNRDCVLFHLERQSVPRNPSTTVISVINAYVHEDKWGSVLSGLATDRVTT